MKKKKCEECSEKNDCDLYNLLNYIDSIKDDYEIEPVIIPYLDTEHSINFSDYLETFKPLVKNNQLKECDFINILGDLVNLSKKNSSDKINVLDLPMISLKENPNHMPVKGRKHIFSDYRIENSVQFWKEILIEEEDKELVEASIEALQYILPDNNIIEDIKNNNSKSLNGVFEKCKKMGIKGFDLTEN